MPTTVTGLLVGAGLLLIVAAMFGGGLEIRELKVPKIAVGARVLAFFVGAALVGLGVYPEYRPEPDLGPTDAGTDVDADVKDQNGSGVQGTIDLPAQFPEKPTHVLSHDGAVVTVAFNPQGTLLASAGWDGNIRLWEVASGRSKRVFPRHHGDERIYSVAFSPNGRVLASAACGTDIEPASECVEGEILLWDVERDIANPIRLPGHYGLVVDLAFSVEGLLASAERANTARVWDSHTRQELLQLDYPDAVEAVAFTSSGQQLAAVGRANVVKLWNIPEGTPVFRQFTGHTDELFDVAFSPTEPKAVSGGRDNVAILWSLGNKGELARFEPNGGIVFDVDFDPSGTFVVTGCSDNTARVWDVATGNLIAELDGHTAGWVRGVAFSPDRKTLATAGSGGSVFLWTYR